MELIIAIKAWTHHLLTTGDDPVADGKVFDSRVFPGVEPPWALYYIVSHVKEGIFGSSDGPQVATITVDTVSDQSVATECENLMVAVEARLERQVLYNDDNSRVGKVGPAGPHRKNWIESEKHWVVSADFPVLP